jgi:para-aminobenzoate synthetase/4-amino-4-deoxychorismate lyase
MDSGASPADAPFSLLETMRLEHGHIERLDRHLARMATAARDFGYIWTEPAVRDALTAAAAGHPTGCWRVRLLLSAVGHPTVECAPHVHEARVWQVGFADQPIDARDPFVIHKTTRRQVYDAARRSRPALDDVVLWNERGEVTESTIANVVAEIDGVRYTPPVQCGLLAGTLRAELLDAGTIVERVLSRADVGGAPRLWLINSVRGWIEAALIHDSQLGTHT